MNLLINGCIAISGYASVQGNQRNLFRHASLIKLCDPSWALKSKWMVISDVSFYW